MLGCPFAAVEKLEIEALYHQFQVLADVPEAGGAISRSAFQYCLGPFGTGDSALVEAVFWVSQLRMGLPRLTYPCTSFFQIFFLIPLLLNVGKRGQFQLFDDDQDGRICFSDFANAISILTKGSLQEKTQGVGVAKLCKLAVDHRLSLAHFPFARH